MPAKPESISIGGKKHEIGDFGRAVLQARLGSATPIEIAIKGATIAVSELPGRNGKPQKGRALVWTASGDRQYDVFSARLGEGKITKDRYIAGAVRDERGMWHIKVEDGFNGRGIGTALKRLAIRREKDAGNKRVWMPLWPRSAYPKGRKSREKLLKPEIYSPSLLSTQRRRQILKPAHRSQGADVSKAMRENIGNIPRFLWVGRNARGRLGKARPRR